MQLCHFIAKYCTIVCRDAKIVRLLQHGPLTEIGSVILPGSERRSSVFRVTPPGQVCTFEGFEFWTKYDQINRLPATTLVGVGLLVSDVGRK